MAGYAPSMIRRCQQQCAFLAVCRRTFSSSNKRSAKGSLVNFPPSSSPELDAIFASARNTVFFQNHLRAADRKLIYKESLHHFITGDEPVLVSLRTTDALDRSKIAKEDFKLEPTVFFDNPSTRTILREILRLVETQDDWLMLSAFLQEYRAAKRKLRQSDISKLIRAAATKGHYGMVVDMFRRCTETGLYFDSKESAIEVMLLCLRRAYASGWEEEQVGKACKNSDFAVSLMTQPAHAPNGIDSGQSIQPEVLGCALALASVRSVKFQNSQDDSGKVLEYAQQFLKSCSRAQIPLDKMNISDANMFLTYWSPAWLGVQLAQRVIQDANISQDLGKVYNDMLGPGIAQARDILQKASEADAGRERRGMGMWTTLSAELEK